MKLVTDDFAVQTVIMGQFVYGKEGSDSGKDEESE